MTRHFAIIGSGPAGIYAAERLARQAPSDRIDLIDRLPTPFGLVRYGVAPDHQATKSVTRILERILERPNVHFLGNLCVGRDVQLDEILNFYDAVILATGATEDRRLGLPGENLPGVVPSGRLAFWYNAHPEHSPESAPFPPDVRDIVIIGHGNVAIDIARVFAKTSKEMSTSDIDPIAGEAITALPLRSITLVGRQGPEGARFTALELKELGELSRARPQVNAADLDMAADDTSKVFKLLREFASAPPDNRPITIGFRFGLRPMAFEGADQLESVLFHDRADEPHRLPAQLAVTAIGYRAADLGSFRSEGGVFAHEGGRIAERLYTVGWAARGPSGTIPTNRVEAHKLADRVLAEAMPGGRMGGAGLLNTMRKKGVWVTDLDHWREIDRAEIAAADPGRPRAKLRTLPAMMNARKEQDSC